MYDTNDSKNWELQRTGKAIQAILKEYKQLHDLNVFQPMKMKDIPIEERNKVLRLITLIKEKRTGQIKGRACANGRPQRTILTGRSDITYSGTRKSNVIPND